MNSRQIDVTNVHFREMVRQQLLGDRERARDILSGRDPDADPDETFDRLDYITDLAQAIGIPEAGAIPLIRRSSSAA